MAGRKSAKKFSRRSGKRPRSAGKGLTDFRAAHDKAFIVPKKIQTGIDNLGNDGWEYEMQFVKNCDLSSMDFARHRERFEEFCVQLPGSTGVRAKRVWAGSKALAAKMREMI